MRDDEQGGTRQKESQTHSHSHSDTDSESDSLWHSLTHIHQKADPARKAQRIQ